MSFWFQFSPVHGSLFLLSLAAVSACQGPAAEQDVASRSLALSVSEHPIGTEPPVPVQYATGDYLSLASSGSEQLLVFYDGGFIRGMRYVDTGTLLDLDPWLPLGRNDGGEGSQAYTDVAYGSGVYLVVYSDGAAHVETGVYAQVVDPSGAPLGTPRLVEPESWYGSVVFNGTDFTVAYMNDGIGLVRVGLDGTIQEETKTQILSGNLTNRPVLAMGEDLGLLVFEQEVPGAERKVYAARFSADGQILDPEGVLISSATTSSVDVSVAAGSDNFLAVWTASGQVYGSLVGVDGMVSPRELSITSSSDSAGGSAVTFDGTQYIVAWQSSVPETPGIVAARLDQMGRRLDTAEIALASDTRAGQSWSLDLTWTGEHFALAYSSNAEAGGLQGRLLGADLMPIDGGPLELTALPSSQYLSGATFNGQDYVVGFSHEPDRLSTDYEFRSTRIDGAGAIKNSPADVIGSEPGATVVGMSLASSGTSTLYSYLISGTTQDAYVRAQLPDGSLGEPVVLTELAGEALQLASNGAGYLGVFFAGANANGNPTEIWGQRFDALGAADGSAFLIREVERPRVGLVRSGEGYLLVYSGQELEGTPITGSVLSLGGDGSELQDHGPVLEGMQSTSVASNGRQSYFVWVDDETASVFGRLLDHDLGWSAPVVLSEDTSSGGVAVGWDGEQFVVVWPEGNSTMWSRRVAPAGTMAEPESLFSADAVSPQLTSGSDGQLLLSYVRYTEWSRARRVESRLIGELDAPPEEQPPTDDPAPLSTGGASGTGGAAEPTPSGSGGGTEPPPETGGADQSSEGSSGGAEASPSRPTAACSAGAAGVTPRTQWGLVLGSCLIFALRRGRIGRRRAA